MGTSPRRAALPPPRPERDDRLAAPLPDPGGGLAVADRWTCWRAILQSPSTNIAAKKRSTVPW
ncbi:MAG: hypothetical protein R3F11_27625 [Verrucomicrobiales bacterium]